MHTNHQSAKSAATENKRGKGRKGWIIGSVGVAAIAVGSFFLFGMKQDTSPIYGKYKISYDSDSSIGRLLPPEETHFMVNNDGTIEYNSTINRKPKYRFKGSFALDEKTNTLSIKWEKGKIPSTLKIEQKNEAYFIKVGNTYYIKGKPEPK